MECEEARECADRAGVGSWDGDGGEFGSYYWKDLGGVRLSSEGMGEVETSRWGGNEVAEESCNALSFKCCLASVCSVLDVIPKIYDIHSR